MSLKIGHRGYLRLAEGFSEPRWREAVVIGLQKQWIQTLVACSEEEVATQQLSHIQVNGSFFALVEAEAHQLRLGVSGEFKNLEIDPKILAREGNTLLQSDSELAYATASDPNPKAGQKSKKKQKDKKSQSSSEAETSEESSDEEGLELVRSAWLGTGTGRGKPQKQSGSKKGKKSKFALIERKKKKKESLEEEEQEAVLKAAAKSGDTLQGLLALQLAQTLKSGKGRSNRRSSRRSSSVHSDDSSDSSEESSSSEKRRTRGHGKAIYNYHQSKKKMVRNPLKYVRKFVKEVEADLGAEGKPFKLTDHNRRISFGRQRNLQRCHYLVAVILEHLLREDTERAALQAVWTLQAMHQAALDTDWTVAWLLTHVPDPFSRKVYGGDPESLQHVTSYLRSLHELTKTTGNLRRQGGNPEDADGAGKGGKKGKKGNKDREKEKDRSTAES